MFKCYAEYYNQWKPIAYIGFRAFTKTGAVKKALRQVSRVESENNATVYYMQTWYRGKKIQSNSNKKLW